MRAVLEFIRNGRLGPIGMPLTRAQSRALVGPPDDVGWGKLEIDKYADVELHFVNGDMFLIQFELERGMCRLPVWAAGDEDPNVHLPPQDELLQLLSTVGIAVESDPTLTFDEPHGQLGLRAASGVTLVFAEGQLAAVSILESNLPV
jgi:hypothetical protein